MKTNSLFLIFSLLIISGCSKKGYESDEITIILPEENANEEEFVDALKNIEIVDLQIDSNLMYTEGSDLRVSPNYFYFISEGLQLTCYEKATGKLLFSKNIRGRGRSECVYANSSFIMGDNIVINDVCKLKMYDHNGRFCGMLSELKSDYVLPIGEEYISCTFYGSGYDEDKCLVLLDSNFNVKGSFFKIPKEYMPFCFYRIANTSPNIYVYNDTLRFICQCTYRLHSFPGNKTYHFVTSSPIPKTETNNFISHDDFGEFIVRIKNNGLENDIYDIVENQDYIMFKYNIGWTTTYFVLMSKSDNKVYSIKSPRDKWDTPLDVWAVILGSQFLYSDGTYFYARAHRQAFDFLDEHKDILDDRQQAIYDTMQARYTQCGDRDFNFYYKIKF